MDTEMTRYESFAEVTEDFYCSAVDVLKIVNICFLGTHCILASFWSSHNSPSI